MKDINYNFGSGTITHYERGHSGECVFIGRDYDGAFFEISEIDDMIRALRDIKEDHIGRCGDD